MSSSSDYNRYVIVGGSASSERARSAVVPGAVLSEPVIVAGYRTWAWSPYRKDCVRCGHRLSGHSSLVNSHGRFVGRVCALGACSCGVGADV